MATVYDIVTDQIIKQLESGVVPWAQPWKGGKCPTSVNTFKPYRGINVWLLSISALANNFSSQYWISLNQAKKSGIRIKLDQMRNSTLIVFWLFPKSNDDESEQQPDEKDLKGDKSPILRYYKVWNMDQCEQDTISEKLALKLRGEPVIDFRPIEAAERVYADMPNKPQIRSVESRAYYAPQLDVINMPDPESFYSAEEYYSTLFHELTHSTGHSSRLSRKGITDINLFATHEYSHEELIAEMGAAFLCAQTGISNTRTNSNNAAYIGSWIKKLKEDHRCVVIAAAQAQKAVDLILNHSQSY